MKYYWLTNTIDTEVIGRYPQCDSPKSIGNLRELDYSKPIENLAPPELIINSKAIPTSYLKGSFINSRRLLIIKDDFLEFIKDFCDERYQCWNIKVNHKSNILNDYYLFYITNPSSENYIEFSRSEFSIKKIQDQQNKGEKIGIPDYSSFVNTIDILPEFTTIACNKLVVNFKETKTDFFKISRVPYISGYFVSERLKNAIEEKGFTGMAFKEIGEIDKRIEVIY